MSDFEANEKLKYTQKHDEIKKNYCKTNNINIIIIPYWENSDLESYLINKLKEKNVII